MNLFTPQTLEFLGQLKENNNRDWFMAHKPDYQQYVQEPLRYMAEKMQPEMEGFDPFMRTDPKRVVSRIYRDTRFSSNKEPYKTAGFIIWRRPIDDWCDAPAWFFEVTPDDYRFGLGAFSPFPKTMANFRYMLDEDSQPFEEALSWIDWKKTTLFYDAYKRPFPNQLSESLQVYYQSKSFYFSCEHKPDKLLYSNRLCKTMADAFMSFKPMYDYLWRVKSRSDGERAR